MVKLPLLLKHDCQYSNELVRKVFGLYHTKQMMQWQVIQMHSTVHLIKYTQ